MIGSADPVLGSDRRVHVREAGDQQDCREPGMAELIEPPSAGHGNGGHQGGETQRDPDFKRVSKREARGVGRGISTTPAGQCGGKAEQHAIEDMATGATRAERSSTLTYMTEEASPMPSLRTLGGPSPVRRRRANAAVTAVDETRDPQIAATSRPCEVPTRLAAT